MYICVTVSLVHNLRKFRETIKFFLIRLVAKHESDVLFNGSLVCAMLLFFRQLPLNCNAHKTTVICSIQY
jgi:hypothetical protein